MPMHLIRRFPIARARTIQGLKEINKTEPIEVVNNLPAKELCKKLHKPWLRLNIFLEDSPLARTPEHYKKFIYEWKVVPPSPVHYIPTKENWTWKDGVVVPERDFPLPLTIPNEMHQGLWGGEVVIKGYDKRYKHHEPIPKYWVPMLKRTIVYSEILDKYMKMTVTERALSLIDEHYGLDNYILKTPPADLMSHLALKLRRQMLLALVTKSLYHNDPEKQEKTYKKYEAFIIPKEEAEWYGLDLKEAKEKQLFLEQEMNASIPYKIKFRQEFIEYLKEQEVAEEEHEQRPGHGLLSRLSPFRRKGKKDN